MHYFFYTFGEVAFVIRIAFCEVCRNLLPTPVILVLYVFLSENTEFSVIAFISRTDYPFLSFMISSAIRIKRQLAYYPGFMNLE